MQEIFITAEQEGWCSPGVLNPSYKMTIRDTEDIYVAVVWSDFWEQAWPKVCEAHTRTHAQSAYWFTTRCLRVTQAEEYFTKKRQEDHIRQRERDRQERLRLRRQRHKFTEGSVFGESDTDAEASVGGEDSLAALARGEFKGAEGLAGGSHGSGRWGADSSSNDRSRSASNASSADTTLDDDSTESESDDSDEELPPDPFWRQTKGGVWRMLAAFKDPYVRAVGGNVQAPVTVCRAVRCVPVRVRGALNRYGTIAHKNVKGLFRECLCKDGFGNERVCVPPQPGYACKRTCRIVKSYVVSVALYNLREKRRKQKKVSVCRWVGL